MAGIRIRRSLLDLQRDYDAGNPTQLENFIIAWAGIKALPPNDPNSFFAIAQIHAAYCSHGDALFPAWHRAYIWHIENALRTIKGCQDVTFPFWDQTLLLQPTAIPSILLSQAFTFQRGNTLHPAGQTIPNPIYSFRLPEAIPDLKPLGYETVRYPLSGLAANPEEIADSRRHNAGFPDPLMNAQELDLNLRCALRPPPLVIPVLGGNPTAIERGVQADCHRCLTAPNFTVFSNSTSANDYNRQNPSPTPVIALERPHGAIHGAVGEASGYHPHGIDGAYGDMAFQNMAGLDPIFFFHHCFIDYVWWCWQKVHGKTDLLEIDPTLDGTTFRGERFTVDTPLNPFRIGGSAPTTKSLTNIHAVGYDYGPGSLDPGFLKGQPPFDAPPPKEGYVVYVLPIDRTKYVGSFWIRAYAIINKQKELFGETYVFGPTEIEGCENCQDHLTADAFLALPGHFHKVVPASSLLGLSDPPPETIGIVVEVSGRRVTPPLARAPRADEGPSSTVVADQVGFEIRYVRVR